MVDTVALEAIARKGVWVRLPPSVQTHLAVCPDVVIGVGSYPTVER